jgi:hypothetical protein
VAEKSQYNLTRVQHGGGRGRRGRVLFSAAEDLLKGIVSRDWGGLQIDSLFRYEV